MKLSHEKLKRYIMIKRWSQLMQHLASLGRKRGKG